MSQILVVDDDEDALDLETTLLESAGHQVTWSRRGAEALTVAQQDPPNVIVADMMMPGMDGLELCRRLRENEALNETKIIL